MDAIKYRPSDLYRLSDIVNKLSYKAHNIEAKTERSRKAELIFEKIQLHLNSFLTLWPMNNEEEAMKNIDSGSLASIARNIIELHNVYHYLLERGISRTELELRFNLMNYHSVSDQIKVLKRFGFPETDYIICLYEELIKFAAINTLHENDEYNKLSDGLRKEIWKGKTAYLWNRVKHRKSPVSQEIESGIYNLLSNSVHSFPLGLTNSVSIPMKYSHLDWYTLLFVSLEASIMFTASVTTSYVRLRRDVAALITRDDKEFIKQMECHKNLKSWIESRIEEGKKEFLL